MYIYMPLNIYYLVIEKFLLEMESVQVHDENALSE